MSPPRRKVLSIPVSMSIWKKGLIKPQQSRNQRPHLAWNHEKAINAALSHLDWSEYQAKKIERMKRAH